MIGNGMEDPPNELDRWIWEWGCVDGRLHSLREQGCVGGCVGKGYTAFWERGCVRGYAVVMRLWGCCVGCGDAVWAVGMS